MHAGLLRTFVVAIDGPPLPAGAEPVAISTRLRVLTGDNVMIGGFIISGNAPKRVIVRAIGPSLSAFGLTGLLLDPVITLNGAGGPIATNDNCEIHKRRRYRRQISRRRTVANQRSSRRCRPAPTPR